ncbi:hypothetical protein WMY93_028441 [Mugilogobius chulae]|uniref:Uncharacterized protein n=1 Tax=Mugilogobius chulae TaxID=88201 RepID=A0AAW0MSY4_9GOBI
MKISHGQDYDLDGTKANMEFNLVALKLRLRHKQNPNAQQCPLCLDTKDEDGRESAHLSENHRKQRERESDHTSTFPLGILQLPITDPQTISTEAGFMKTAQPQSRRTEGEQGCFQTFMGDFYMVPQSDS